MKNNAYHFKNRGINFIIPPRNALRMKFVGANDSMGLIHGKVYYVIVFTKNGYVWVQWWNGQCPYSSLKKVLENWEEVKE